MRRKTPNEQTHKLCLFVDYLACKLENHNQIINERIGRLVGLLKRIYKGFSVRLHTAYLKIDTVYLIQDDIYTEPRKFILHDTL